MDIYDLRGLYRHGLQDLHDTAVQTAAVLPILVKSVKTAEFRSLVEQQAVQATKHCLRLAATLKVHGALDRVVVEPIVAALLQRAEMYIARVGDADLLDAALLSTLRRIVHHRIAACMLVSGHAKALSLAIDHHALTAMLGELRTAERDLAGLEEEINQLALIVSLPTYL